MDVDDEADVSPPPSAKPAEPPKAESDPESELGS